MLTRRAFLTAAASIGAGVARPHAQQQAPTHVFYDPATLTHQTPSGHPETPDRMRAVMRAVDALERDGGAVTRAPRAASDDDVLLVHTPAYLKTVRNDIAAGRRALSTGDTELSPGSLGAALAAAGTVISAIDAVAAGRAGNAFCVVRPPGHHASQARGMGFCIFNNLAIGARYAQRQLGVARILVADWDVHHGNGTQAVFWNDGSVLFFDTHQHPWYPGTGRREETGEGRAEGLIVNRPFPAGAGRDEIVTAYREELVPVAERFRPELVMVSAGFDSRAGDPLGQFTLTDEDFGELTAVLLEIARVHAGGRLVSVLEGGYALDGLSSAVAAHLARLGA